MRAGWRLERAGWGSKESRLVVFKKLKLCIDLCFFLLIVLDMKLKFSNVMPRFIISEYDPDNNMKGLEVLLVDGKPFFDPESKPTKEERRSVNLQLKGMKRLFKEAARKSFVEKSREIYMGNKNSHETKYYKLLYSINKNELAKIGGGAVFWVIGYFDGSYKIEVSSHSIES